jgi:arginyl-tRNA synthetase
VCSDDGATAIKMLYEVYVAANKKAEADPNFGNRAKELFARLEHRDPEMLRDWKVIRDLTVSELEKVYERVGVRFDHYHGESMYGQQDGGRVLELLADKGLLKRLPDGRQVVDVKDRQVVVAKSDGSSLYIGRDVAAAVDRRNAFSADKVCYVVETGQAFHFENLFEILSVCGFEWSKSLSHVNFGRIEGMSTRRGTAVFLSDILNEGRDQMFERMSAKANTKVESEEDRWLVSDMLSTTAVIINDLKQRRAKSYAFAWENALHSKGDSGIKLQYTHARYDSTLSAIYLHDRLSD